MLQRVKKVEYLRDYKLKIFFKGAKIKIVDLEQILRKSKGMFLELLDIDYFKKVECDGFSITWPNGIDFCPDLLYQIGKNIEPTTKKRKNSRTLKTRKRSKVKA